MCLDEVIGSRDEGKHQVAAHSCDTKIADNYVPQLCACSFSLTACLAAPNSNRHTPKVVNINNCAVFLC